MNLREYTMRPRERLGWLAVLAICLAAGSIFMACSGRPIRGLVMALLSLPMGLAGFIRSASPEFKGGMLSLAAIGLGIVGVGVAVVALVFGVFSPF